MSISGRYKHTNGDNGPEPESQVPFEAFIRPPLRSIDKFVKPKILCLSHRYTVAVMAFLGFFVMHGTQYSMLYLKNSKTMPNSIMYDAKHFLGWGNFLAQIPGGILAYKFPATKIFGLGIVSSAVLNLVLPLVIEHRNAFVTFYFLQGFAQGVTMPALFGIWRFWAPPLERSKLATIALSGSFAGMLLDSLEFGHIHWTVVYIFFGIIGIVWYGFWYWLVFEKPRDHPAITEQELVYIEKSLGESTKLGMPSIPWTKIFSSMPVYAIIIATFCQKWGLCLLVYQSYFLERKFYYKVNNNGLFPVLKYLTNTTTVLLGGFLTDYLRQRSILSTTNVRKIFNCVSFVVQGLYLLFVPYAFTPLIALLATLLSAAFSGFAVSGFIVNHLDIAPRFASIAMGISNAVGFLASFICSFVTELAIFNPITEDMWEQVFTTSGYIFIAGAVFYGIFSSGELQSWAEPKREEQKNMNEFPERNRLRNDTNDV